jgi:hypothetical protein
MLANHQLAVFLVGDIVLELIQIDYVTISSTGNAVILEIVTQIIGMHIAACSDAHGGLGD